MVSDTRFFDSYFSGLSQYFEAGQDTPGGNNAREILTHLKLGL